jgi:hypothetical protein
MERKSNPWKRRKTQNHKGITPNFPTQKNKTNLFLSKKNAPRRERESLTSTIMNNTIGDKDSLRFINSVSITAKINSVKTQTHNFSKNINPTNPNKNTKKK